MDFDGREHEFFLSIVTKLDMHVVDSVWKHDPIIVSMVIDDTELYKRMICEDKEMLQHMVKYFAIKNHASFEVVKSTPTKWIVQCKKSKGSCR